MGDPRDTTKTGKSVTTLHASVSKTFVPANSPAGGGGNGYFTSPLPYGRLGGFGLQQQVSPAAKVYDPEPGYSLSELWDGGLCISEARFLADFAYGPQSVIDETGKRIEDIMEGLLPGLLMVGCVVGISTLLGAAIGGVVGFLAFGAGAAPGAAIGAEVGFDVGMALVTWVGLGFLVVYIAESLGEVSSLMVEGVGLAWNARGKPPVVRAAGVHAGAKKMGKAIGVFVRVLLEAIVLYLLEKGAPYVAARLSELVGKLKASKLGSGFAEWVLKNYKGLLEDPKVNPKLRNAKPQGGATEEAAGSKGAGERSTEARNATKHENYKKELRRQMEKPHVKDPELKKLVDRQYREGAKVGSGSTADAIRHEKATGEMVGGKTHTQKGENDLVALKKWLKNNPTADSGDRAAAENIIKDLNDALGK
jgi:hypothetical protein